MLKTYKMNDRLRPHHVNCRVKSACKCQNDRQLYISFIGWCPNAVQTVHDHTSTPHHWQLVKKLHFVPECHVKQQRSNSDD
jgi:hypothetical protein